MGRLVLCFGNLNNGAHDGLLCVNSNNGLGNRNWNVGSRNSGVPSSLCVHWLEVLHVTYLHQRKQACPAQPSEIGRLTHGLVAIRRTLVRRPERVK